MNIVNYVFQKQSSKVYSGNSKRLEGNNSKL